MNITTVMNNLTVDSYSQKGGELNYPTISYWFDQFGSKRFQEILMLSLLPTGIIGAILNVLGLIVLRTEKFNLPLYSYLRHYLVVSTAICLIGSTRFVNVTRRMFSFSNSFAPTWYMSFIYVPLRRYFGFYGSFLDVILALERFILLSNQLKWFRKMKPIKFVLICGVILLLLCVPNWFYHRPAKRTRGIGLNKTVVIYIYSSANTNRIIIEYTQYIQ
jgi:hypothetical protein